MQIVILAGGEGTRLRPLTSDMPKPLVRILGQPVIERLLALLFRSGFSEATIADFYLADKLESELGSFSNGVKLSYVREDVPMGTAGCVRKAWNGSDDVLVVSGDSVCEFDFRSICEFHKKSAADVTIVTHRVADPREYGLVTSEENGRIVGFLEKPGYDSCLTDTANTGTYIISAEVISRIPLGEKTDFANDVFPQLLRENKLLFACQEDGIWHDIGDISSLIRCQKELVLAENKDRLIFRGASVAETAFVGDGSVIEDGTLVGDDCRVQGSLVMKGTALGEGTVLNACVVGENVTTGRGCVFGEASVIGNECVIGSFVTVESGVRIENGVRIPSGAHLRSDVHSSGYTPLSFGDLGEAEGISLDSQSALRLGMAVSKALEVGEVTVGTEKKNSEIADALAIGLRSAGTAVYFIEEACFGETVFSARSLGTEYCFFVSDAIRLLRSDRLELLRSEERKIEQSFNRGELSGDKSAPIINAQAASSLYKRELKSRAPSDFKALLTLKTDSFPEAAAFSEIFGETGGNGGPSMEFTVSSDRMSVFCMTENRMVPYEDLVVLGCKAAFLRGAEVALPGRAPSACEIVAEEEKKSITRVSSSDSIDISPFSFDPLFLIADILWYLNETDQTIEDAASELPKIVYTKRTVAVQKPVPKLLGEGFSGKIKNGSMVFEKDGARAFVKPLKSGKALSMYVESVSTEAASSLCDGILEQFGIDKSSDL